MVKKPIRGLRPCTIAGSAVRRCMCTHRTSRRRARLYSRLVESTMLPFAIQAGRKSLLVLSCISRLARSPGKFAKALPSIFCQSWPTFRRLRHDGCSGSAVYSPIARRSLVFSFAMLGNLRQALRPIHHAGYVLVRIDRNPGRVVAMCCKLWELLQAKAFLCSQRYVSVDLPQENSDNDNYGKRTVDEFVAFIRKETGKTVKFHPTPGGALPFGYWTVQQKSTIMSFFPCIKFRPIISHASHPCRPFLRRVARSSVRRTFAIKLARTTCPSGACIRVCNSGWRC